MLTTMLLRTSKPGWTTMRYSCLRHIRMSRTSCLVELSNSCKTNDFAERLGLLNQDSSYKPAGLDINGERNAFFLIDNFE